MQKRDHEKAQGRRPRSRRLERTRERGWSLVTDLALQRRTAVLLATVLLVVGGVLALRGLTRELFPDVEVPVATVMTVYPGADPQSVADEVTKPIEEIIFGLPGVESVESISEAGASVVVAQFAFGTPMSDRVSELSEKLTAATLPEEAQAPRVMEMGLDEIPAMRLSLARRDGEDTSGLRQLADDLLVPGLADAEGVQRVAVVGGGGRRLVVVLDADKVAEKGVSPAQVAAALQAANVAVPAGEVARDGRQVTVRVRSELASAEEVAALPLPVPAAAQVAAAQAVAAGGPRTAATPGAPSPAGPAGGEQSRQPAAPPAPQTYVVQRGDTLGAIAKRFYGDEAAWRRIVAANPGLAADPDRIAQGLQLVIPPGQGGISAGLRERAAEQAAVDAEGADPLTIGDLGEVRWEQAEEAGLSRTNGKPSVSVLVYAKKGADLVRLSGEARQRLDDLAESLAERDGEVVVISDQATYIERSLGSLARDALLGGLFAVFVIAVFLVSLRSTAVIAVSIPTSLLLTFLLLAWRDTSLNLMTLGGLAVSMGRLVDDAIVILEAVHRHRRNGEGAVEAARNGAREVGGAVVTSTLTTVVVFLPLAFVGGVVGEFFRPFALAASLALSSSLIISLTVIPVLGSYLMAGGRERGSESWVRRAYNPLILWALRHRVATLGVALAVSVGSLGLLARIETTFLPTSSEKILQVKVEMPAGTPASATGAESSKVEAVLDADVDVEVFHLSVGDTGSLIGATGYGRGNSATGDIFVRLRPDANLETALARLDDELSRLDSQAKITAAPVQSTGATDNKLEVVLTGSDRATVARAADRLARSLADVDGLVDAKSEAAQAKPELSVDVDAKKAAARGLAPAQVAKAVREMINGQKAGTVEIDGEPADIVVEFDAGALDEPDKLARLAIAERGQVTLGEVAAVELVDGPIRIVRRDGEEATTVSGTIATQDTGRVNAEVRRLVDDLDLPAGVEAKVGGVLADQTEGFASFGTALLAAVGLVYLVMVLAMGSLSVPLVVLASLPLASLGALSSLFFTGRPLGMSALIGLLMLVGIVVTNAVVLLDRVGQLRGEGRGVEESLVEAGRERVRPILMTALTTLLGLAPLAMGLGEEDTLFAAEMATVVIGGLTTATALTLIVVPVVYSLAGRFIGRPTPRL